MPVTYKVQRIELRNFPLISWMYYTGEELNPYRCQCCLTAKQRRAADKVPEKSLREVGTHICCRKCGVEL